MNISDIFKGMAKKYNHYQKSNESNINHFCSNCIRRQFSFPYTCSDGWEKEDKGNNCMNWTDDNKAAVD